MIESDFEVWKDIKGYGGYYQVSNLGNVKSLDRYIKYPNGCEHFFKGKNIKFIKDKDGYNVVNLKKHQKGKFSRVNRLVAQAFIPNPNNYPIINHKDEIKSNNKIDNLEWCTYKYNSNYGHCIENNIKARSKRIYQYDLEGNFIKEWFNSSEAEKSGYNGSRICMCCNKNAKTSNGFIWSNTKIENFDKSILINAGRNNKSKSKIVIQYDLDGNFIKEWPSAKECQRNGYNQAAVSRCCLGKQKTSYNFIWRYKEMV